MMHELKILPAYFKAIKRGDKTFEIRNNKDRGFQKGDHVVLKEWKDHMDHFTGEELVIEITYVTSFSQKEDMVVFSFFIMGQ